MGGVLAMEIKVVRRAVVRFEDSEILLVEMCVPLMAGMKSEEHGVIGVVGVENEELPEVKGVVAGDGGEIRVK